MVEQKVATSADCLVVPSVAETAELMVAQKAGRTAPPMAARSAECWAGYSAVPSVP